MMFIDDRRSFIGRALGCLALAASTGCKGLGNESASTFGISASDGLDDLRFAPCRWNEKFDPQALGTYEFLDTGYVSPDPGLPDSISSTSLRSELEVLKELEVARTQEQVEAIRAENSYGPHWFLLSSDQISMNPRRFSKTQLLIEATLREVARSIFYWKRHYLRCRPYDLDVTLSPSLRCPGHPSYPSGHGGQSRALAVLLSELEPERSSAFLKRAAEIGRNREIAGLHFASDTRAGVSVADSVMRDLFAADRFRRMVDVSRSEWA